MCIVSFVLLNYNSGSFVDCAVDSLAAQTGSSWEVIVVDNGSTDDSLTRIRTRLTAQGILPRVTRLPRNLHFAAGMNAGIREAVGEVIVCLNSDVFLHRNYTTELISAYRVSNRAEEGSFCGTQYRWDWSTHSRGSLTEEKRGSGIAISRRLGVHSWHNGAPKSKLLGPSGCAPAFTRSALDHVVLANGDYYDSRFVAYGEDLDLLLRMRLAGYRPVVVPEMVFWHIGSASYAEGRLSVLSKPPTLVGQVLANKWRIWRKIPSRTERAMTLVLAALYDLVVLSSVLVTRPLDIGPTLQTYHTVLSRIRHETRYQYVLSPGALGLYSGTS